MTCECADRPAPRSTCITASRCEAGTWMTAPASSENSALRVSSSRCTATCSGRIL
ncbi:Uncharacterised protein [Bordetella pertussis]|nr:Uncharacterised protein [Bordetella pertussis]